MTARCGKALGGWCACFRPHGHKDECACQCTIYGTQHGAQPSVGLLTRMLESGS